MKDINLVAVYSFLRFTKNDDGSPDHPSYDVHHKQGQLLGAVEWYDKWRKYCFYPEPGTGFDRTCLSNICHFIETKAGKQ